MRRLVAALVLALLLVACSNGAKTGKVVEVSTTLGGIPGFLYEARLLSFGSRDLATASEEGLLELGNTACEGLTSGMSIGRVAQAFVESDAKPTATEAHEFIVVSVSYLCPSAVP